MNRGNRTSTIVALAFFANVVLAATVPVQDGDLATPAPSAAPLARFYPTPLATSPIGVTEDKDVWLAKVQSLIAAAPPWIQQNVLGSRSKAEFIANIALLEQMQKGAIEQGVAAVKSLAASGRMKAQNVQPNALGGGNGDLVYTALEPCRIMDSRNAEALSLLSNPLQGNHLYSIPDETNGGWVLYGGSGSDCGLSSVLANGGPGNYLYAIAMVITILNPNFDAYLGVSDQNDLATVLASVALNFTHGQGLSTLYIVPQVSTRNIYFAMPSGLTANIIFDVVGYFAASHATGLSCLVENGAPGMIPAFTVQAATSPACPFPLAITGGNCKGTDSGLVLITSSAQSDNTWFCKYYNSGAPTSTIEADAICCQLPGR